MKIGLIIIGVLVLMGLLFGGKLMGTRNELVTQREAIKGAWADVDNNLQRRADLIPNLVETVKGYAKEETTVFTNIANARSALIGARTPAEKIQANSQVDSALSRLLVIAENYPQLKANENFLRLQDELTGTENRIAISRRRYNETVQKYNTSIELFPNNIAAASVMYPREAHY